MFTRVLISVPSPAVLFSIPSCVSESLNPYPSKLPLEIANLSCTPPEAVEGRKILPVNVNSLLIGASKSL